MGSVSVGRSPQGPAVVLGQPWRVAATGAAGFPEGLRACFFPLSVLIALVGDGAGPSPCHCRSCSVSPS